MSEDHHEGISAQLNDEESIAPSEIGSETFMGEEDMMYGHAPGSRKRKRGPDASYIEQQHTLYSDSLLDYFMLSDSDRFYNLEPPLPPEGFQINRAIEDQGHTALHWAAAMGDVETSRMFIARGARIDTKNLRGETPLIRSVHFTNNYEKETMSKLVDILQDTLLNRDSFGATVLHHVAMTTKSSSRKKSARHYLNVLLTKLIDILPPQRFAHFLDTRDQYGDTAVHILARYSARKCVRIFLGRGANIDIPNSKAETASDIMQRSMGYPIETDFAMTSSSPVQPAAVAHTTNGLIDHSFRSSKTHSFPANSSSQSFSASFGPMINDKALQLNLAMEDELQSMDASYADAIKINEKITNERNQVRQRTFEISMEDNTDSDEVRRLQEQCDVLTAANESFLEQEQHGILHQEVRAREQNLPPETLTINGTNGADADSNASSKIEAAHALAAEQIRRRELSRQVVQAQALAGMTEQGEEYKKLIARCLGVPVADVPALTPEILGELEMGKGDEDDIVRKLGTVGA